MPTPRVVNLWPDDCPHNDIKDRAGKPRPLMEIYQPQRKSDQPVPAIVVCPGGGYGTRAGHEGTPFAELFAANGYVGVVCHYRVAPYRFPAPMADAARAVRLVRSMARDLNVDAHKVGIMGFSAGGHLAATTATQPDLHKDEHDDLVDKYPARPDRCILGYPVISFVTKYHAGSAANLLGPDATEQRRRQFSNELQVTAQNPPTFMFHTADDGPVPVQNSLNFAAALAAHKVKFELHVYEHGRHGVGLASNDPKLKSWTTLMLDWLKGW